MKKFVLKLDLDNDKDKRKALKTVSTLAGVDLIAIDMKEKKMTVVGTVDPVSAVSKLRKFWQTDIISVGPAKEPEKKEEAKKEEPKKEEAKKEEPKKEEPKKEEAAKKEEPKKEEEKKKEPDHPLIPYIEVMPYSHRPYYHPMNTYYQVQPEPSIEENPNACVIS